MRKAATIDERFQLYLNSERTTPDIAVYEAGWERCDPLHAFGPTKREFYLLHYVHKGHGRFSIQGRAYDVGPGEMFQITPGVENLYVADKDDPWEYHWIGFNGPDAKDILRKVGILDQPVFKVKSEKQMSSIFMSLKKNHDKGDVSSIMTLGVFYQIMAVIANDYGSGDQEKENSLLVVDQAINYISTHLQDPISVSGVADILSINRSHLFRLFKEKMGISLKEYITNARFTLALLLLKEEGYSIKEVSERVGYQDYPNFLKTFKKRYGVTPKQYRSDPFETVH